MEAMKRVLVVDDEESIRTLLTFNLEKEGFVVEGVGDGQVALEKGLTGKYDFIILDLMLPGLSGTKVCKELRQAHVTTPIMMLTAKDEELDKIIGLELGADDYMTKPFSLRNYSRGSMPSFDGMTTWRKMKRENLRIGNLIRTQ